MNSEVGNAVHSNRRRRTHQGPWCIRTDGDGAKWCGITFQIPLHVSIEPAVGDALVARCPGFHVVLRVEMRSCVVRRSGGMDDSQMALVVNRLHRVERRMQPEETIKVDRSLTAAAEGFRNRDLLPD